jgi:hypothetical protein
MQPYQQEVTASSFPAEQEDQAIEVLSVRLR